MKKNINNMINFIDVTFREWANLNDLLINKEESIEVIKLFNKIRVNYIEIGYTNNDWKTFLWSYDKYYIEEILNAYSNSNIKISLMFHPSKFDKRLLDEINLSLLWLVRIVYDKNSHDLISGIIPIFKKNWVKIAINITGIYNYSFQECISLAQEIKNLWVDIIYLADTEWRILPSELWKYIDIIKENTKTDIWFHPHDHTGLSMVNTLLAIEKWVNYIDFSLLWFWKWMANLNAEKFFSYMYNKTKDISFLNWLDILLREFISLITDDYVYKKELEKKVVYTLFWAIWITLSTDNKLIQLCNRLWLDYYDLAMELVYNYNWDFNLLYEDKNWIDLNNRVFVTRNWYKKIKYYLKYFINKCEYYNILFKNKNINTYKDFCNLDFLNKSLYRNNTPPNNTKLCIEKPNSSFIFSSWWTTSAPRLIYRDYNDLDEQYKYFQWFNFWEDDTILNLFMPWIWWVFTTSNISLTKYKSKIIPLWWDNLNNDKLLEIVNYIRNFNVNCLIWVPSTIVRVTKFLENYTKEKKKIKKIYCLWERIYPSIRKYLSNVYDDLSLFSVYWCMESAWIWYQDNDVNGDNYKIFPYQFVEIISPITWKILNYWEEWEIIITTLKKRLIPLIRFRTWDYWTLNYDKDLWIEFLSVSWRSEDLIISATVHIEVAHIDRIIKDNNFNILDFQLHISNKDGLDYIVLVIEIINQFCDKDVNKLRNVIISELYDLDEALKSKKIWWFDISCLINKELQKNYLNWKLKRVFDYRK